MTEVRPLRREPTETQGATHPGAFVVGSAEFDQVGVNCGKQFRENILESTRYSSCGKTEAARQQPGLPFHSHTARKLARSRGDHPVAYGKNKVGACQGSFPCFAQIADVMDIEIECKEGVLIVGPKATDIREP